MKKNFKDIDIFAGIETKNGKDWQKENGISANWKTPEQIEIQPSGVVLVTGITEKPSSRNRLNVM